MSSPAQFLEALLASETRGDLLVLFHRNPGLIDTMDGVARRIGRTATFIEKDVLGLVRLGVLKIRAIGTAEVISLDQARDHEVLESVANHLKTINGSKGK